MSAHSVDTRYAFVTALAMAIAPPLDAAQAADSTLDLSGFEGTVSLQHSPSGEARVSTEGWTLVEREGRLILEAHKAYQESSGGCSSAFDRPSFPAPARQSEIGAGKTARVEIAIPASMRVLANGFSGALESSVVLVDPRIEITSGTLALVQVLGGELTISGPGAIKIGQAAGHLDLAVSGAGSIDVRDGRIDKLTATLRGRGSIRHDGVVRRAALIAGEAGEIRIRQVEEPIRIEQAGTATIAIACKGTVCEAR